MGGVLFYAPAVLAGESALCAAGMRGADRRLLPIEIGIDRGRSRRTRPGYRLRWVSDLERRALWIAGPPRLRIEEALLDAAARAPDDWTAVAILADACQSRRTTARRILAALDERLRVPRRAWLAAVLRDLSDGTCSALEHEYLVRVERAHRLPRPDRQKPGEIRAGNHLP